MNKLYKCGEKYDIVILDPPSSSYVGDGNVVEEAKKRVRVRKVKISYC